MRGRKLWHEYNGYNSDGACYGSGNDGGNDGACYDGGNDGGNDGEKHTGIAVIF